MSWVAWIRLAEACSQEVGEYLAKRCGNRAKAIEKDAVRDRCRRAGPHSLTGDQVDFRKLEDRSGLEIKESVALSAAVGGTAKRPKLSRLERLIITPEAGAGMRALGYSGTCNRFKQAG